MLKQSFSKWFLSVCGIICSAGCLWSASSLLADEPPQKKTAAIKPHTVDPRLILTLVAEQPLLVTPTGLSVDSEGRVWVIESNTHFPPEDYKGLPTDRVLVFTPDAEGKISGMPQVFAEGFTHAMSILVTEPGAVYLATRKEVLLLRDTNGDLQVDDQQVLLKLETAGDYPHNGLAGFARDAATRQLYIGLGENLGAKYKLVGPDGIAYSGEAEGGSLFRFRLDGSNLTHWSTGFWNPHASCFNAQGELFTVDNDPDSRPPCRLLHVTPHSDFGYRFRNGRRGTHPFTAWNGELPGTLPMVSGTGEAPSGIISYDAEAFPEEYQGTLLVGSWGDHRIDRFTLKPKGSSYTSHAVPVVKGGEDFRPVGLALAPDGSVYFTDWVLRDYKVHGHGRLWRLSAKDKQAAPPKNNVPKQPAAIKKLPLKELQEKLLLLFNAPSPASNTEARKLIEASSEVNIFQAKTGAKLFSLCARLDDKHLLGAATWNVFRRLPEAELVKRLNQAETANSLARASYLVALRRKNPNSLDGLKIALHDLDFVVQQAAVQWVGEAGLKELRPELEKLSTHANLSSQVFQSLLATFERLDGTKRNASQEVPGDQYVLTLLVDASRPASLRAQALRMLPAYHHGLTFELLTGFLQSSNTELQRETLFTLQQSPHLQAGSPFEQELLKLLGSQKVSVETKTEIVFTLGKIASQSTTVQEALQQLDTSDNNGLERETLRALRGGAKIKPEFLDSTLKSINKLTAEKETGQRRELAEQLGFIYQKPELPEPVREALIARPVELAGWKKQSEKPGDQKSGRRVFFHHAGAGCYRCHMVQGRGGSVGPDLSNIARTSVRKKLAESILEPHKEIAPQFTTFSIVTKSGKTESGIHLGETADGKLRLGESNGNVLQIPLDEIEEQQPQKKSIMPEKLIDQLTAQEFCDLLAYLESLR